MAVLSVMDLPAHKLTFPAVLASVVKVILSFSLRKYIPFDDVAEMVEPSVCCSFRTVPLEPIEPLSALNVRLAVSRRAVSLVTVIPSSASRVVVPVRFLIVPFS